MECLSGCPDVQQWERLLLGQLPAGEMDSLGQHLAGCRHCLQTVRGVKADDTLVEAVRSQVTPGLPPLPAHVEQMIQRFQAARPALPMPAREETVAHVSHASPSGDTPSELPQAAAECTEELFDFLAPAERPGEIGRLGPYRVLRVLGAGGMGVVFEAEDPHLRRRVALKAMRPALAANTSARKRFLREAEAMAAIEHDHVVRIYQVAEDRGVPYLAMELLEGEPLDERLKREAMLPLSDVLRIGREIAEGLEAAHGCGLIHRDIKPANIWLQTRRGEPGASATGGRVKILDFGLARAGAQDSGLTQQGAIVGTPAYMAPEQARGEAVDARCDLFSLGVLLYRICSGQPAFRGKDTVSTLLAVAMEQPPPPRVANPELPTELSDLVMQLLEKDPQRRPASAAAVVQALQALEQRLLQEQRPHHPADPLRPLPKQAAPVRSRRLPVLLGSLVLLAGLVGAGLWALGVFRVQTAQGELVLESDDPSFAFSAVNNGGVTLEDRKANRTYSLKVVPLGQDRYQLAVLDKDADLAFHTETFTVQRGDKVALKAWFERRGEGAIPPPASASQTVAVKEKPPTQGLVLEMRRGGEVVVPTLKLDSSGPFTIEATVAIAKSDAGSGTLVGHPFGAALKYNSWNHPNFALPGGKEPVSAGRLSQKASKFACVWTGTHALTFQDGKLIKRETVAGVQPQPVSKDLVIGQGLIGRISDVRISRAARYERNYDATQPLAVDKDTLALYPCDDDAGKVLKDWSGNAHHGKILGARCVNQQGVPGPEPFPPIEPAWFASVAAMPAEKQVEAVLAKLQQRNPLFDGKLERGAKIVHGEVTELEFLWPRIDSLSGVRALTDLKKLKFYSHALTDLGPLRGLKLTDLNCSHCQVADLSPLTGMPLTRLSCSHSKVTDLSPLKGLPLTELNCNYSAVSDLASLAGSKLTRLFCDHTGVIDLKPVAGMPLVEITCDFQPERDAAILRAIKTLEKINGKPAAEFWKQYPLQPQMP